MTQLDIIVPVNDALDWVSSLVMVKKNNIMWVSLDPRNLNKAIKREHYHLPTVTDIFQEMAGTQYFTKSNASNAFRQIKGDEESSKLLTFNSPYDHFRFLRIPYGIYSANVNLTSVNWHSSDAQYPTKE